MASLLILLCAAAQDFGVDWVDRVTHEREQARAPLAQRPVDTQFQLGGIYTYDTNIFLDPSDERASNILIPFARGRIDYATPRWDAAADLLIDYKQYLQQSQESHDDERAFGRIRYAGPKFSAEAAEIFRHETDPVDVQFTERAERFVSTTTGHAAVEVAPDLSLEGNALLDLVYFRDSTFDDADHWSLRADLTAAWRFVQTLEGLLQAGTLRIDYQDSEAADTTGWFARVGFRGDPTPLVSVSILAGLTEVRSETIPSTGTRASAKTGDVSVNLRAEPLQGLVLWGDYTRQIGFSGPQDPFEIIDRWLALAEWQATPQLTVRGRIQYDRVHTALGQQRSYWSLGPALTYAWSGFLKFEAGLTWRTGDLGIPGDSVFTDFILHAGFVLTR